MPDWTKDLMLFSMNSGSVLFSNADWILSFSVLRVEGRGLVAPASSALIRSRRSSGVRRAGISARDEWRAISFALEVAGARSHDLWAFEFKVVAELV